MTGAFEGSCAPSGGFVGSPLVQLMFCVGLPRSSSHKGLPGPQNVLRRVDVCILGMTARDTAKRGLCASILGRGMPAARATLTGVGRGHKDQLSTSLGQLVRQHLFEAVPARIEDASIEGGLGCDVLSRLFDSSRGRTRHIRDFELLEHDGAVVLGYRRATFMLKVAANVRYLAMNMLDSVSCTPPVLRASFLAGQGALGHA